MNSLKGLKLAVYARFSSDNQRDTSIDDQVRMCSTFIEGRDGKVLKDQILADYAVSGRSLGREGFDRLLQLVESRAVDVVVTESGDRLSRDLGDSDRLWKLAEYCRVRLICVSDGIDSAHDGARMAFRFKAVMADEYLVDLGKKTLRGLKGAALRGHCTGGLPYGYKSEPIWNGRREPEGYRIEQDPEKAAVVVRIFEMYRAGHSLLSIATTLNREGVMPPRFGARSKKRASRHWRKTTLRELIRNEAYIGLWTFGVKQWRKDPTTRKRKCIKRPVAEVQHDERPHLRIIPEDLWEAVRERCVLVAANYAGNQGGAPGRRTAHPFAGILFCSLCGNRMVDVGGGSSRHYRCSGAVGGGICHNRRAVREDILIPVAVAELKRVLLTKDLHDQLHQKIEARVTTLRGQLGAEEERLQAHVDRLQKEVGRLLDFIRTTDPSASPLAAESLRSSLEQVGREHREAQARLDRVRREGRHQVRLPSVEEFAKIVLDVEARIQDDPTAAREAFRNMLEEGRIEMEPLADGSYKAKSTIFPLALPPGSRKPRRGSGPSGVSSAVSHEVVGNDGCAGRI